MEKCTVAFGNFRKSADVLHNANLVVGMHETYQQGIVVNCFLQHFRSHKPVSIRLQIYHFVSQSFRIMTRVKHGLVLNCRGYYLLSAAAETGESNPGNSQIVTFGGTGGKYNLPSIGTDEIGYLSSGNIHGFGGLPPVYV